MKFEHDLATIEEHDDGSVTVTMKDGRIIEIDKDGNTTSNLSDIKSVGIENITDLESYTIMREGELNVHHGTYRDGGHFKLAYTSDGTLKEFTGRQIGNTITRDNEMMLRSSTAAEKLNEK